MQVVAIFVVLFVSVFGQKINKPLNLQDDKNIERPCDVVDTDCIRRYFKDNAYCEPQYRSVPDPLFRKQTQLYLSRINVTSTLTDVTYKGLNGRITEFYINRESDKLVLSVEFRNVYTATNSMYARFYRRGREPIVTVDYFNIRFKSVTVTIIIPQCKNLQLQRGEVFSFGDERYPEFDYGPKIFASSDPAVQAAQVEFYTNPQINIIEGFLTEGSFYITTFIQYTICDFGLNLI